MLSNNRALKAAHPDEPWLWKKSWAEGRIRSVSLSVIVPVVFAVFWTAICVPIAYMVFIGGAVLPGGNEGRIFWWVAVALTVVNGLLIVGAIIAVMRWLRYGRSEFVMASVPGVIGGQLAGVVRCSKKLRPQDGFRVKLICLRNESSKNSDASFLKVLWENEQLIAREILENDPTRTGIPILFQIPYHCRSTNAEDRYNVVYWRLEVMANCSGMIYQAHFTVPVFRTPQSDPDFEIDESLITPYVAPVDDERDLHEAGVRRTTAPNGDAQQFVFPMGRQLKGAIVFGLLGVAFLVVSVGVWFWMEFWFLSLLFSVPFGLIGLFGVVVGFEIIFYKSTVEVSPRGLAITGGLFGRGRRRWVDADEVVKFNKTSNFQSDQKKYYDLIVVCQDGQKITAAKRILGNRLATSIVRQIEQAMGRES